MRIAISLNIVLYLCTLLIADEISFTKKPIFVGGLDDIVEYRIPAMVTTGTGTLIAICDARVDRPGDAINNVDIAMKRSKDFGRTWDPMRVIVDFPGEEAACDPCMVFDKQTDKLWIFYDHILAEPAKSGTRLREQRVAVLHAIQSQDGGDTWSPPRDITRIVQQAGWESIMAGPGSGTQTRDGHLLVPCYTRRTDNDYSQVLVSKDHGKSWKITNAARANTNEAAVVELNDGRWLFNMRDTRRNGCRLVSITADGGRRWETPWEETGLPGPCCQGSLIRYTDVRDGFNKNRLLFSNPADSSKRQNMTVRMSYDEGKTWPVAKLIDTSFCAYSCLTVLSDGTIGLLYEHGKESPYEQISFTRFDLQWLTDGTDRLEK